MPCLLVLLALFIPRVAIAVLWFFTTWFAGMFNGILWPLLGFIFAPTSLIWYSFVHNYYDGVWSAVPIAGMVVAVLIDFSPAGGRRR